LLTNKSWKNETQKFYSIFKTKVVLDALKELQTTSKLAVIYQITPLQISTWKRECVNGAEQIFGSKKKIQKDLV
jgi:transposase